MFIQSLPNKKCGFSKIKKKMHNWSQEEDHKPSQQAFFPQKKKKKARTHTFGVRCNSIEISHHFSD